MRLVVALAVLMSSSIAAAQAPGQTMSWDPGPAAWAPPPPPVVQTTETISYRRHILLADGLSLALMTIGPATTQSEGLAGFGLTGYLIGAPLVHLSHGRGGAAVKSLAMRSLFPIIGAYLGYKVGPNDIQCGNVEYAETDTVGHAHSCTTGSVAGLVIGMIAGGVTAVYVDATYLAKYQRTTLQPWSASLRRTNGGYTFGISRAF